jgi:hypothetical protein
LNLLWVVIGIAIIIKSVNWSNLGYCSNHLWYVSYIGQAMCFEPKPKLIIVVKCINFCLHLMHYCENWSRKNWSFELALHIWWFWFKVVKI